VHLSTDAGRENDDELIDRLERFPAYGKVRDLVKQAVSRQGGLDLRRDVRPWLGDEAAFALLPSSGTVAPSLLLLSVADEAKAETVVSRAAGSESGADHRGVSVRRVGGVAAAFTGGFLAIGQEPAVRAAIDRSEGAGANLAESASYLAASASRPPQRVIEAYLSPEGVRRVLRPQSGLLGALGGAIDHPGLRGASLSASPADGGVDVLVRAARTGSDSKPFRAELLDTVPESAFGYLGLGGLAAAGDLLPRAGADLLLERAREALPADAGVDLDRDVLAPLRGEVAVSVAPSLPFPEVTLVARTADEQRTREALGRLQGVLADALAPAGEAGGSVPTFEERELDGVTASALSLGPAFELIYAVFDGLLVVSTSGSGIERVRERGDSLRDTKAFKRAVGDVPERSEALVFLDLRQLLTLGDLAGLTNTGALQTARDDLRRIRTVGAAARREGNDTIAEFFLEVP